MTLTPKLAGATVVGTLGYLGLAVLGSGGFAAFFSHPGRIALALALFVLAGVALFSGGNLSSGQREDRANRWILIAFALIGPLNGYLQAHTDRKGRWTLDQDGVRWLGVVLFTAGGGLRIGPVFVLDRRFSGLVAIQPGHTLVTTGVYRVIRHPSYPGLLVNSLGWALAFIIRARSRSRGLAVECAHERRVAVPATRSHCPDGLGAAAARCLN